MTKKPKRKPKPLIISQEKLELSASRLRAIAHPLRMQILEFIDQNQMINVNKIYNTLKLEQSITSQHLRILRDTKVVETKRKGKYIYYTLNYGLISNVVEKTRTFNLETKDLKIRRATEDTLFLTYY